MRVERREGQEMGVLLVDGKRNDIMNRRLVDGLKEFRRLREKMKRKMWYQEGGYTT